MQVVGFSFLFLLKNNGTENSYKKAWHLFNSYLNLGQFQFRTLDAVPRTESQKGAEICTCPREVIEEALGTKGTGGWVMFWFVPKELFFCFWWASKAPPQEPSAVSVGALEDTRLLLALSSCWHKGNLRISNKWSKHEAWPGVGQGHEYMNGLLACYRFFSSQHYFCFKDLKRKTERRKEKGSTWSCFADDWHSTESVSHFPTRWTQPFNYSSPLNFY